MTFPALRYASSGPFVTGPNGGQATPGSGMQLRLVETESSIEQTLTEGAGANLLALELTAPTPQHSYRASFQCTVNGGSGGSMAVRHERSIDDGATWATVKEDTFGVQQGTSRTVRSELPMQLGGGAAWDIPANSPSLLWRVNVRAISAATGFEISGDPQGFFSLAELL